MAIINGSSGNDSLEGTDRFLPLDITGNDVIKGLAGDDELSGYSGDDTLYGGLGNDLLYGGGDNDGLYGGDGDDELTDGDGNDGLYGGNGNDLIDVRSFLNGNNLGTDNVDGGAGVDTLTINYANFSRDITLQVSGTSIVAAGVIMATRVEFLPSLITGSGNDTVTTGNDDNSISTRQGNDTVNGRGGNDSIDSGDDNDVVNGDTGNDEIFAGTGDDQLNGGIGNDTLSGHFGNDTLVGGTGSDSLDGGDGNDRLEGGLGVDRLTGGGSADQFVFNSNSVFNRSAIGTDTLTDFAGAQQDKLVLSKTTFSLLASAIGDDFSNASEFAVVNTDASAAIQVALIVYNSANGRLFYNQNGAALGFGTTLTDGGLFAQLTGRPALAASDFVIQA